MGIPRQEYWSRLPFPSPGNIPNPGAGRFFTTEPPGKPQGSTFSNFEHLKIALSHGLTFPLWWRTGASSNRWYWWGFQRNCELFYPLLPVCSEVLQPFPLIPASCTPAFFLSLPGDWAQGQLIRERCLQQHSCTQSHSSGARVLFPWFVFLLMNRADTAHLAGNEGGVGHFINFPVHLLALL